MTNEAFSRVKIDAQLRDQDWEIENPNAMRFEYVLGDGTRADYVLCDRHGRSMAVIEAKRFWINPGDATEQAKGYARQLRVPYIFLANGEEIRFWEWESEPYPRAVKTFFKQADLERRFATRQVRQDVLAVPIGLRLTEGFLGAPVMLQTARYMNVDPPKREQRLYSDFVPRTKHGDGTILKAQQWLSLKREHSVTVADAARHVALEPRTFLRRFVKATGMKPIEYQQRLRVSRARELLEFSRSSVDVVAARVGYDDVAAFWRVFRKIIGLNPSEYRRRFATLASMDSL